MKIKFKIDFYNFKAGEITDALIRKVGGGAWVLDQHDVIQYTNKGEFDLVVEEQPNKSVMSLRDLLGQDVKSLEFK